jgi:hypothetical protein
VLPEPGVGPPPVTTAPVELKAETTTARVGKNFALEIWTNATTSQAITGVEVYLNFDPSLLEVVDSQPSSGVQIEPDRSSLDTVLANAVYNTQGQVTYGAGKLAAPFPTSTFRVATIHFTAKQPTPDGTPTEVKFSFEGTRSTIVDFGGNHITGQHVDASVTLVQATVTGQVVLQGGSRPDGGWQVPLEVKFFTTSSDPLVDTPVETFNLTTQIAETDPQTGKPLTAIFTIASAPIGSYDITVDSPHTLMTIKRNVAIVDGQTSVDFGPLLEGDANDDGKINISDFGILGATFGGLADSRADFDRNGIVNISDFGLLAVNYAKMSPIDAP